jgi:alpha-glucosidase
MQMAAFTPFFRNHTMVGTLAHEPWTFGPGIEGIVRQAIELRYQLLPYWYCLFAEAHRTGTPIMRPLLWHHQTDPIAVACGDQFLLGRNLLVAPVLRQGAAARSVYLPSGIWFDFWTGKRHRGNRHVVAEASLERIPLFIRGGAILPMAALRQHTAGDADHTVNLHVWPGGRDTLDWYEDDGTSMQHTQGAIHRRRIDWDSRSLKLGPVEGTFSSQVKTWRVLHRAAPRRLRVLGVRTKARYNRATSLLSFEMKNRRTPFTATLQ